MSSAPPTRRAVRGSYESDGASVHWFFDSRRHAVMFAGGFLFALFALCSAMVAMVLWLVRVAS